MAKNQQQVVHESETQRQYIRVPIPSRVEIDGEAYSVKDLSSGGIGIEGIEGGYKKGDQLRMTLILPFAEFSLDVHLEAQVQSYSKKEQLLGARFTNLSPSQISLVNNVIRSYISGDVMAAGDVLDIAQRSDIVRVRNQKDEDASKADILSGNLLPLLLISMIGLFAFYIIVKNIYQDVFVLTSSIGVVKAENITFRAPVSGIYSGRKIEGSIKRGTEIARLSLPDGGQSKNIDYVLASPCECFISKKHAYEGEYLLEGAPIYEMTPVDSRPYIEIFVESGEASRVHIDDQAYIFIAGVDERVKGQVTDIIFDEKSMSLPQFSGAAMVKVIVRPDRSLPFDLIDRPVTSEFTSF